MNLIGVLISITILSAVAIATFPQIVNSLYGFSTLGNFTFTTFFETSGVVVLILSAIILIGILAMLGVKMSGGGKR